MNVADAVPNLLIGLREGLEAGLVVSILLAALRKVTASDPAGSPSTAPVWLGVAAAVSLAGSFAAVLTFSTSALSSAAQEAVGGSLSVLAVFLVTGMVFWMRRTARTLSKQLRGEVERAARIGAGALTLTAFLAVGREGLETTLFLWTAAQASGQTIAPLAGAAVGIAAAIGLCWLLYRRAVKLNVGVFFNRTAIALVVIAAGVLAYGLGDLQDAGLLPGQAWIAFDLTAHVDPGSWWVSLITGVTELSPKMTVLQVTAWLAYLAVVIPSFVRAGRQPQEQPQPAQKPHQPSRHADAWERLAGNRPWAVGGVLVGVPVIVAGTVIAAVPAASSSAATAVTVTKTACAPGWSSARSGAQAFTVTNQASVAGEIRLMNSSGQIVGEIETLGPGTSAQLNATLGAGTYTFKCLMGSQAPRSSAPVRVTSAGTSSAGKPGGPGSQAGQASGGPAPVKPVTVAELTPPNKRYEAYAARQLAALAREVSRLRVAIAHDNLDSAKRMWLTAQQDWERVGASYDSFGALGEAVDGLPSAYQEGASSPRFTGLHRLEYGLWHGQGAAELEKVTGTLAKNVARVRENLTSAGLAGDPANLPIRAHEIAEDALRDHLSGMDDEGAGAAYPMTAADLRATRVVLGYLAPLLNARRPGLVKEADGQMDTLSRALGAARVNGKWRSLRATPLLARQRVTGATGALLQTLSSVPDLLEVPPRH
ncbi:MAG: FTR1 family protein [Nocardiopsaceae bacterium]|nr:FTR1 family protein [Nocardiopsaceae bacterium]